ncbi:hypothetical protein HOL34_00180 [bacterium]|jgi:hypothetical protein|nr:hypothetical protein [bacterium]MBT3903668.1 hypothetical protein [bacterium]MBT4577643.1 hypothetical protein [bacterium]MBT5346161.1 hypothetical protein [bacterium]MBT6131219.1 hypothetical protein [bacterium]
MKKRVIIGLFGVATFFCCALQIDDESWINRFSQLSFGNQEKLVNIMYGSIVAAADVVYRGEASPWLISKNSTDRNQQTLWDQAHLRLVSRELLECSTSTVGALITLKDLSNPALLLKRLQIIERYFGHQFLVNNLGQGYFSRHTPVLNPGQHVPAVKDLGQLFSYDCLPYAL